MLQLSVIKKDVEGATEFFKRLNLVMVVNDRIIVYDDDTPSPELKSYSDFRTFPIRQGSPRRIEIPVQRCWFRPWMAPGLRMWGFEPESEEYITISQEVMEVAIGEDTETDGVVHEIVFTVPTSQLRSQAYMFSFLSIMADTGGHFDFFREICEFLFALYMPILLKTHVVSHIFVENKHHKRKYTPEEVHAMGDHELIQLSEDKLKGE